MTFHVVTFIFLALFGYTSGSQEYNITPITSSSGLYYEKIGEVLLSNSNWEFVTSVDYAGYLLFYQYLQIQAENLYEFCRKYNSKSCNNRIGTIRGLLSGIDETDESMANFMGIKVQNRRVKRFWDEIGNFFKDAGKAIIGGVPALFGGGGSQVDLSTYDRQIGALQSGQMELVNKFREQRTVFLVESQEKAIKIEWLKKTQGELQNKIESLENDFLKDSAEKQKQLNELKGMLIETNSILEKQVEAQKKLENDVDQIKIKLLTIDESLQNMNADITKNEERINKLELDLKYNSLSIDFMNLIDKFKTKQEQLFTVIKNAKKGDLDPYILTPLKLINILQEIQPSLREEQQFPYYPNLENAANLYNIIKADVYLYNNKIIFTMKIPLVYYKKFEIHKITSMPISISSDKFVFILPHEPYLLVDSNDQEYMLLSHEEFSNDNICKNLNKNLYFCKQIQQVSNVYSSNDCEIKLFLTATEISDSCDTRLMVLKHSIFLQLQKERSWIYVTPGHESLTISCGSSREILALSGAGFISLASDCMVRTNTSTLESIIEFTKPVVSNFSSPVNLTSYLDLSDVENWKVPKKQRHSHIILPFDLTEMNEMSFPISRQRSILTWLYYILGGILMLIIIGLGVCVFLNRNHLTLIFITRFINVFTRINPQQEPANKMRGDAFEDDKLELKVKLNTNHEKITRVSVNEYPSSKDPDSHYMAVRLKVKENNPNMLALASQGEPESEDDDFETTPIFANTEEIFPADDPHLSELKLKLKAIKQ